MELLTINETAKRGPLKEYALRQAVKRGEVPGFQHGNRFLINYSAFLEELDKRSRANVKEAGGV